VCEGEGEGECEGEGEITHTHHTVMEKNSHTLNSSGRANEGARLSELWDKVRASRAVGRGMVRGDAHRVGPLTGRRARTIVAGARRRPGTSPQRVPALLSATSVVVAVRRSAAEPSRDSSPRPEKQLRSAPGTEQHELDPPVPGATGGAAAPPRGVRVRPRARPSW
jgi:hypothetical protein